MTTLVTTYVNPDLDGYGGAVAYAELLRAQGQDAIAAFTGTPLPEVQHVLERFNIPAAGAADHAAYERFVVVDTNDPTMLDFPKVALDRVVEVIDHHKVGDPAAFPNAAFQIEVIGAAATLVAERYHASGYTPSRDAALLLLGGIISNSINFQLEQTSPRDRTMAAWLTGVSGAPEDFAHGIFAANSDLSGPRLAAQMEADNAHKILGDTHVTICQLEIIGTDALLAEREQDILATMRAIVAAEPAEHIFLILTDIGVDQTIFVTEDAATQLLLSQVLPLTFDGVAARHARIMRKQVWPLLKAHLVH